MAEQQNLTSKIDAKHGTAVGAIFGLLTTGAAILDNPEPWKQDVIGSLLVAGYVTLASTATWSIVGYINQKVIDPYLK